MAKIICPNCGGENNVTKTSGQECQYCGSSLIDIKERKQNTKEVKSAKEETLYYVGKTKISPSEITEKAKHFIKEKLEKVGRHSKYWEIVQPIDEKINLFSFETKLVYAPVYVYTGSGKSRNGDLLNYCFLIESGGDVKDKSSYYADFSMAINYEKISFSKFLAMSLELKKGNAKVELTDFPNDPYKLWNSVRGRDMRKELRDWDDPKIYKALIPLFVVLVNIGEDKKYYIIYDWTGDELYSFVSAPEYAIAEELLGKDYKAIIDKQWEDKQAQSKQQEEYEEEQIMAKRKEESKKTNIGCAYISICALIIIASGLYGFFYAVPNKKEELHYEQVSQEYERKRNEEMEKFEEFNPEKTFIKEFKGVWWEGSDLASWDAKHFRFKIINGTELQYQTYEDDGMYTGSDSWRQSKTVPFQISSIIKDGDYNKNQWWINLKFENFEGEIEAYERKEKLKFSYDFKLKDNQDNTEYNMSKR